MTDKLKPCMDCGTTNEKHEAGCRLVIKPAGLVSPKARHIAMGSPKGINPLTGSQLPEGCETLADVRMKLGPGINDEQSDSAKNRSRLVKLDREAIGTLRHQVAELQQSSQTRRSAHNTLVSRVDGAELCIDKLLKQTEREDHDLQTLVATMREQGITNYRNDGHGGISVILGKLPPVPTNEPWPGAFNALVKAVKDAGLDRVDGSVDIIIKTNGPSGNPLAADDYEFKAGDAEGDPPPDPNDLDTEQVSASGLAVDIARMEQLYAEADARANAGVLPEDEE